jgi:hypothetical protein
MTAELTEQLMDHLDLVLSHLFGAAQRIVHVPCEHHSPVSVRKRSTSSSSKLNPSPATIQLRSRSMMR